MKVGRSRAWIDKAAFVYVRTESQLSGRTVRTSFSDFRKVKGFEIPYSAIVTSDGKVTMTTRITQVETGGRFPDDLFDPGKLPGAQAGGGADLDAAMKRAEEMKRKVEAMTKAQK
jgi:outer membrane lipoprotein-sorting protein